MLGNLGPRIEPPGTRTLILGMQQGCFHHTSAMRDLSQLHLDDDAPKVAAAPKDGDADARKKRGRTMCRGWRRECKTGRRRTDTPIEKNRVSVPGGVSFFVCFDEDGTDQESDDEDEEESVGETRERTVSVDSDDSFIVFDEEGAEPETDGSEDESDSDSETESESETEEYSSLDSIIPKKRVRFASPSRLCKVRTMKLWVLAHRKLRVPYWLHVANDRARFRERILRTESVIDPVLSPAHRSRIFEERFSENQQIKIMNEVD